MIVEDERENYSLSFDLSHFDQVEGVDTSYSTNRPAAMEGYIAKRTQLRNKITHYQLKQDLVEHIWQKFGNGYLGN